MEGISYLRPSSQSFLSRVHGKGTNKGPFIVFVFPGFYYLTAQVHRSRKALKLGFRKSINGGGNADAELDKGSL